MSTLEFQRTGYHPEYGPFAPGERIDILGYEPAAVSGRVNITGANGTEFDLEWADFRILTEEASTEDADNDGHLSHQGLYDEGR